MAPVLRRSQLQTLQTVLDHPGGYIRAVELAKRQETTRSAAERKLRTLVKSGHLRRANSRNVGHYVITSLGKDALAGEAAQQM